MATVSASAPGASSRHDVLQWWPGRANRAAPQRTRVIRRVLREFASFAGCRGLTLTAVLVVVGTAVEGVGILLIVPLLRAFLGQGVAPSPAEGSPFERLLVPLAPATQLAILFGGFLALMLLRALALIARDTQLARLQLGFVATIKLGLFERLAGATWKDVMAVDRSRLNRALGSDMVQAGIAVNAAVQTAAGLLMLAAYGVFALVLAPMLALLTFAILAAVGLAGAALVGRAGAFGRAALDFDLRTAESTSRFLNGLKLAKAEGLEAGFMASYAAATGAALETRVAFVQSITAGRQLVALLGALAAAAAVAVAFAGTDTDPALLVTFVLLLARTATPVSQLQQGVLQVAHALPLFAELHDLGDLLPTSRTPEPRAHRPSASSSAMSLRSASVTHRTTEGEPRGGLSAVALDIGPGEFIGLSGPTGSGKSTLLDLLAGLQAPDEGDVLVDGRALSTVDAGTRRTGLAYLAAEPVLFGGSLRRNLAWAAPGAADADMWRALAMACASDLVERLGLGLDSRIFDAGGNLSAGERQQVALARALLRRPSLLLLDEATCSLDRNRERSVLANLAALVPRPTIVLVSHRAESFAQCDRVVTLSEGQIQSIRSVR